MARFRAIVEYDGTDLLGFPRQALRRRGAGARWGGEVWAGLALGLLRGGSAPLLGRHDFAAFGSDPDPTGGSNTVRTVSLIEWRAPGPAGWLTFDIQAEAFLFRMVRALVGALKRVGTGELAVGQLEAILASGDRAQCPPIAPAHGLCLMEVIY